MPRRIGRFGGDAQWPEALGRSEEFRVAEGYAYDPGGVVPGTKLKRPYLWLGSEDEFHKNAATVLGFAEEAFTFADCDVWRWQQRELLDLFQKFFREAVGTPAWVSFVPLRDLFNHRFRIWQPSAGTVSVSQQVGAPRFLAHPQKLRHEKVEIGCHVGELGVKSLQFCYAPGRPDREAKLVRLVRNRRLRGATNGQASDWLLFLSIEDADDVSEARVPTIDAYHDEVRRINTTPTMTLARMQSRQPWDVTQLAVTLNPHEGSIVSFAAGRRPLEMFLRQYPLECSLLTQAGEIDPYG